MQDYEVKMKFINGEYHITMKYDDGRKTERIIEDLITEFTNAIIETKHELDNMEVENDR